MHSWMTRLILLLLVLMLGGCWALSPPTPTPAQQSKYSLDRFFADPQAQALALAAERGDAQAVQRLMKVDQVNPDVIFGQDGMPLLAWPIFTHSPAGLKAMLENGADPNAKQLHPAQDTTRFKGRHENNALVWAAEQEDPIYLKLLLDHGGDPDTRNSNGETLLFHAFIKQNQWQNVKLLVERGADVNAYAGMLGNIISHYAGRGGFEQIYWLLQHGADPAVTFSYGKSVIRPDSPTIESIFWAPGTPPVHDWQRKCQLWLVAHGYKRPPMPDHYRKMRKDFGYPYEEEDIPLVLPPDPPSKE